MTASTISGAALRIFGPQRPLSGEVAVPGDKSISHRALMLGALGDGTTRISHFLAANDCIATLGAIGALGVEVERTPQGTVLVHGRGLYGLAEPSQPVYCGGSGSTMRLLAGLLAGQPFYSVLTANAQLSRRPMDRVAVPLHAMGATVLGRSGGKFAPLSISGGNLHAVIYRMPVASAQVKSAILLAGLFADGATTVEEEFPTRDHTERLLGAMGAKIETLPGSISIEPPTQLRPLDICVPGDISSAAFLMFAASIVPSSRIILPGVGVNPTRTGVIKALLRMGGRVVLHDERLENGEPVADIEVSYNALEAVEIGRGDVPGIIDELPVLAVAATQAAGVTEVRGAAELRVKETDRIATTVAELTRLGAHIEGLPDGFRVVGQKRLQGAVVSSHGDHRLAMALAVAGLVAEGETIVEDAECIGDSFPGFAGILGALMAGEALR